MSAFKCATHGVMLDVGKGPTGREHRTITKAIDSGSGCILQVGVMVDGKRVVPTEADLARMTREGTGRLVAVGGGRVQAETIAQKA